MPGLPDAEPPLTEVMQRALTVLWALGPEVVLDLGCGPGRETLALTAFPGVRVVAIDTDQEALANAPEHANVLYVRADATRLPLASSAAQAAYSFGLLQALGGTSDALVHRRDADRGQVSDSFLVVVGEWVLAQVASLPRGGLGKDGRVEPEVQVGRELLHHHPASVVNLQEVADSRTGVGRAAVPDVGPE